MPPPSNMWAILQKIVPSYKGFAEKNKEEVRLVTDFFGRMLLEACPSDPFATKKNIFHSKGQIDSMVSSISFQTSTQKEARIIGRLISAAGSLVHGLYNDLTTDLGWEGFGPYQVEKRNLSLSFLFRWFPNMQPSELWPAKYLCSQKEIKVFTLYEGVTWEISFVGCHTIATEGSPVMGMREFAVIADGKELPLSEIEALIIELSEKAERIYREIRGMGFEELKLKVMQQECFQLKALFDWAAYDWAPTQEMVSRVKNKPLLQGILPHGVMVTDLEVFKDIFGIRQFANEVLGVEI